MKEEIKRQCNKQWQSEGTIGRDNRILSKLKKILLSSRLDHCPGNAATAQQEASLPLLGRNSESTANLLTSCCTGVARFQMLTASIPFSTCSYFYCCSQLCDQLQFLDTGNPLYYTVFLSLSSYSQPNIISFLLISHLTASSAASRSIY